jgi:hypothetical protein
MVKVIVTPNKADKAASPADPAPPAPAAAPPAAKPPETPDPKAREDMEHEQFLQSPVTRALLSKWACKDCGTPVDRNWTHCPVCGSAEMRARKDVEYDGFEETMQKYRAKPNAPPKDPTTP